MHRQTSHCIINELISSIPVDAQLPSRLSKISRRSINLSFSLLLYDDKNEL